jgi:RNA polymerase-binding transcription factor DksA
MAEKKAKLATDVHEIGSHLTQRRCRHCGEQIPADKLYPVRTVAATTRMTFYNKDHYKGV